MSGVTRRGVLAGGAAAVGGAAVATLGYGITRSEPEAGTGSAAASAPAGQAAGALREPFYGVHQAGIATPIQAHGTLVAFDLLPGSDRDAVSRLMRLLTDDAARLTQGRPALADSDPELTSVPARLTITFGFGPRLFDVVGRPDRRPASVRTLPAFGTDRLQPQWSGGDLLVQVCADDPLTVSHAVRMLTKDVRAFARLRWTQSGFQRARGSEPPGTTGRNLMGHKDGTVNPKPGSAEFDQTVWAGTGPDWFHGGSVVVIRRIRINLETWDAFDRAGKELAIGRRLDSGAPLTGTQESDPGDLNAVDSMGFPVIPEQAHLRRARATTPAEKMLRRPFSYDSGVQPNGTTDSGLIFIAYQADADTAFVPVQRRLAESDALNLWITHIGSAVFAVPPGVQPGGWVGQTLLT